MGAWPFIAAFGTVGLLADFVYEGARSITGPLLAAFGATGSMVGSARTGWLCDVPVGTLAASVVRIPLPALPAAVRLEVCSTDIDR